MNNLTATVIALTPPSATATITDTPLPTATDLPTATTPPTSTPLPEDQARSVMGSVIDAKSISKIIIDESQPPKLLIAEYPLSEGVNGYNVDYAGRQIVKMVCALYAAGFTGYQYQLNGLIHVVDKSTGKESDIYGITAVITSDKVSTLNCANAEMIDVKLIADKYHLNPLLSP
jgi:hypothetical protein